MNVPSIKPSDLGWVRFECAIDQTLRLGVDYSVEKNSIKLLDLSLTTQWSIFFLFEAYYLTLKKSKKKM